MSKNWVMKSWEQEERKIVQLVDMQRKDSRWRKRNSGRGKRNGEEMEKRGRGGHFHREKAPTIANLGDCANITEYQF